MKVKMKIWTIFLILILSVGLSACNNKAVNKKEDEETYQIDWYLVTSQVPVPSAQEAVEKAANEYLKDKLNVTLKMHYLDWSAYYQKINVMIAGNEKFDICFTHSNTFKINAAKNAYLPLNDLIDKYAPKTKEMLGEEFLKGSQINGINYGLPANKDKGSHFGVLYRKDLAEKYNLIEQLNAVKDMNDIYPILDIIKENEPDIYPLREADAYSVATLLDFDVIVFPGAFYPDAEDGKVVNYVETPEFMEAAKITRRNQLAGYNRKGDVNVNNNEDYFMAFATLKPGKDKEVSASRKYEYVQIDLTTPRMRSKDTIGSLMAISTTCKRPEKAMQFLELFNTDKYLNNLIVYGLEGVNYTKINENIVRPIPDSGYGNAGMQWIFGNTFINYLVEGEDPDKYKKIEEYNKKLKKSDALGFSFDSEPVKAELGACQNIYDEYNGVISRGLEDPEIVIPQYIEKLKRAGSDKIIAEMQRQYDEWVVKHGK